jgi:thioredoxin reductase (NADPH)
MDDAVVRLYGKRESPQAYAIRDYLQRSDIPFEWVELKDNQQARAELGLASVDDDARLPICIFPDGTRMERPTVRQVTEKLGWFRNPSRSEYDVAIYGAGPAGLRFTAGSQPPVAAFPGSTTRCTGRPWGAAPG